MIYGSVAASFEVLSGKRMEIPYHCPPVLAQLMKMCWEEDPNKRPDFDAIIHILLASMEKVEE